MSSPTSPASGRPTLSIATRLTLWAAGLVFGVCALLCVGLYLGLSYSLLRQVDTFLRGEVREFLTTIREHPDDPAALQSAIRHELGSRTRHDLAFRLFDAHGRLRVTSEINDHLAPLWHPPRRWPGGEAGYVFQTLTPPHEVYSYRTCSLRFRMPDGQVGIAQASYRLDEMAASLARFRQICVVALAIALGLSLATGRLIAERNLRPLRSLIRAARALRPDQLDAGVPRTHSGDELDQLAATINDMLARIARHVRQLRQFTADAAHELRTPIAALRGNAEVALTRRAAPHELRTVLAESIDVYDHLSRIADDLLLLARADAGELRLQQVPVRVDEVVADVLDLYGPLAQERGIELAGPQTSGLTIHGDPARLRQLVGNLIDNAVKYTPTGGRVCVSLRSQAGQVELEVADTGPGIPPEDLDRVFDRFYRADRARTNGRRRGAGLGLSICRTITEAHGGRIALTSARGQGTRVTVRLPSNH